MIDDHPLWGEYMIEGFYEESTRTVQRRSVEFEDCHCNEELCKDPRSFAPASHADVSRPRRGGGGVCSNSSQNEYHDLDHHAEPPPPKLAIVWSCKWPHFKRELHNETRYEAC